MKEFVIFLALGLMAPVYAYHYGHSPLAPPGGYYHAHKSYASFAAWCVDFACTKDETYTYYNSVPFYTQREKCNCNCPTPENGDLYYKVLMDYRLLVSDATVLRNGSVSDLKNYCPRAYFKGRLEEIRAWDGRVAVEAYPKSFDWNPHVPCKWKTSTGVEGTLILTRVIVDTQKKFSVVIYCLPKVKFWVVHSPSPKPLGHATEKNILELLRKMNMDTSKIFRPDFSRCEGSGYEEYEPTYNKKK